MIWTKKPLAISVFIHLALGALAILSFLTAAPKNQIPKNVKIEIKEVAPTVPVTDKPVTTDIRTPHKPKVQAKEIPRKIFGINKSTLTDEKGVGAALKAGNTLAKAVDQEKLLPSDAQTLPIPADEYLITAMPKLKAEFRIPYPPEARAKSIEGLVLLDILIDENGKVLSATVVDGPGHGLNEAALQAIYSFQFAAARIGEKPVPVKIRYGYRFVLN